jgi:uncharacterized protein
VGRPELSPATLAPGVHRQAVAPSPPPADALETGVPVFLGLAERRPARPVPVASSAAFAAEFGDALPNGHLARAVDGFFANGGRRCWVIALDPAKPPAEALEAGLAAAETFDDADLVCVPDAAKDGVQFALPLGRLVLAHCRRMSTRVAILDTAPGLDAAGALAQAAELRSENAALYHPWLVPVPGVAIPPCGAVAGVIARTDRATGVHKAPANEPLENVVDLAASLSERDTAALTAGGVNCNLAFPGRGIRVWGARTTSADSAWRYLNSRRVVLTLARELRRLGLDLAFEENSPATWRQVSHALDRHLLGLYSAGALRGETALDAYSVRCDESTNPPESQAAGRLVAEVTLAPTSPAEVVLLRMVRHAGGVTVETTTAHA